MKRRLLDILICPACLPGERPLGASVAREEDGEIVSGRLDCSTCGSRYPIEDGTAHLLPGPGGGPGGQSRYEEEAAASAYLWSHYGDVFDSPGAGDPEAGGAYRRWAGLLPERAGLAIDFGCAVGRMSWEMAARSELAVGLYRSRAFVGLARRLAREGTLDFGLSVEGTLSERRTVRLPAAWRDANVEFVVGDALAPPFPAGLFGLVASLNLLDRVPRPLRHLQEVGRVAAAKGARLVFSDPFSWSAEAADESEWLGGRDEGPYPGSGPDNVRRILERETRPPWSVSEAGALWWKIRNHRNHYELIRSEYFLATR
ncbi:MAG: SAM-dependent methyltransferase [Desulfuromonas sp.]|uniref:Trm112 family protein n=1 Tax=Desulfuromonas sp. TaxID=892 RepID=UPI000CC8FD4C|nr:Trm112 family protein [Desulfuromonas sp.]PLX86661.1 MAG: SAM-dependent methyltransferase [Desulfuromonas sp.]